MLSSGYNSNARENFLKMEEQTVPSAGFSPQPEYMTADCGSNNYYGVVHHPQHQNNGGQQHPTNHNPHHHPHPQQQQQHQQMQGAMNGCLDYSNLADSFDLSLLGDSYDDKDMATVPSPSSWSPLGALEPNAWQQMSFYAASPPELRAFSPDCKPFRGEQQNNGNVKSSKSNLNVPVNNNGNGTHTPPPPQQQQMLDVMAYPTGGHVATAAAVAGTANVTSPLSTMDHDACNRNNALLRQCLEDNTFIEKYNFKPLDLPITSLPSDMEATMENNTVPSGATNAVGNNTTLELNQIEPMFNLAYEQIISDIQNYCRTLAISPDPMQWSVEDVQSWLCYSLTSFSPERGTNPSSANSAATNTATSNAIRALWNIDGHRLCSLNEEDFRRRDPLNGERIFANLELLKMWKSSAEFHQSATQQQQAGVNPAQAESNNGQAPQQTFDLGQILLAAGASTMGGNGAYSCSGSPASTMEQSPAPNPSFVDDLKVELEDSSVQQASNQAKFSNPSSVDTASSSSSSMRHSDVDDDEEEEEDEKPATQAGVGSKTKTCGTKNGAHIHLWQFLKELLASGQQHGSCIRWLDQSRGVFKIEDSVRVARLWGIRKNRPAMNYDKLSRSIRQYYRKGIMRKTERSQRLVYQFVHPYGL